MNRTLLHMMLLAMLLIALSFCCFKMCSACSTAYFDASTCDQATQPFWIYPMAFFCCIAIMLVLPPMSDNNGNNKE